MTTHRITELIQKFCPHSFNIPIDRKELEDVVEKLYQLMFPTSSKMDTHITAITKMIRLPKVSKKLC